MRRATQIDVAQRAGVSQATVSLVLRSVSNGTKADGIPPETFERVRNAAEVLGYVPNRFAQAMRTRRSMTIACVVPDVSNPFYPSLLRGVQAVTGATAYDVILIDTDGRAEREQRFLKWGLEGRVDGVIGVFFSLRATDFQPLANAGIGVVRIEPSAKTGGSLPIDDIYVDNDRAVRAVMDHLRAKGHRRIAMIAGKGGPRDARVRAYEAAMREVADPPRVVLDDAFTEEGGYRATRVLLGDNERPSAVFAANDLMAIGALEAAREAGLNVPEALALVGFDDIFASRVVAPPLTTVAQFQYELGRAAAETLLRRLKTGATEPGTAVEMPFALIERQST